jgi:hypothetical protein
MTRLTPGAPTRNASPALQVVHVMSTMTPAQLIAWIADLRSAVGWTVTRWPSFIRCEEEARVEAPPS